MSFPYIAVKPNEPSLVAVRFNIAYLPMLLSVLQDLERHWIYEGTEAQRYEMVDNAAGLQIQFMEAQPLTISGAPIGQFAAFAQILQPDSGWLPCGGQFVKESDYPLLIAMFEAANEDDGAEWELSYLEEDYGAFLPGLIDRRGITGVHPDWDTHVAGEYSGSATHTLTIPEMPEHDHPPKTVAIVEFSGAGNTEMPNDANGRFQGETATGLRGGGQAHNNMPPNLSAIYHISAM